MEEIKIGEYVRTKNGKIIKCTGFGTFRKEGQRNNRVKTIISGHCHYIYDYIVKHSLNIIDLVEVGDYVNGKLIHKVDVRENDAYIYYGNCKTITNYQIESIVTKEQFESVQYKLNN